MITKNKVNSKFFVGDFFAKKNKIKNCWLNFTYGGMLVMNQILNANHQKNLQNQTYKQTHLNN